MDPASIVALLGGLVTIATAVIAYFKWKRGKIENLAQSEVDELKSNIEHPDTGGDKLFLDKPETPGS